MGKRKASSWLWKFPLLISCEDSPCVTLATTPNHNALSMQLCLQCWTQMVISVVEIGFFFFYMYVVSSSNSCLLQHPTVLSAKASRLLCVAAFRRTVICSMVCVSFRLNVDNCAEKKVVYLLYAIHVLYVCVCVWQWNRRSSVSVQAEQCKCHLKKFMAESRPLYTRFSFSLSLVLF